MKDPRGKLFLEFVRIADELRPHYVLFENVAGLVTAKDPKGTPGGVLSSVQAAFEGIGYACRFALLNAADYGAPQRRVRLFMVATAHRELPEFPVTTHARTRQMGFYDQQRLPWTTLREFLAVQPKPTAAEIVQPSESLAPKLRALKPGTGVRANGIVEANRPGGHWGYRQDQFLADLSLPARTIRAASTPDWIVAADDYRRLTLQECAGLQGFPKGWAFVGTFASCFRQVGNAVQGHVASAVGEALAAVATAGKRGKPKSATWPREFHTRILYTAAEHAVNGNHRAVARSG